MAPSIVRKLNFMYMYPVDPNIICILVRYLLIYTLDQDTQCIESLNITSIFTSILNQPIFTLKNLTMHKYICSVAIYTTELKEA